MSHPALSGIWTKICGITRADDAEAAANSGADAVGLVLFRGSPRVVDVADCEVIFGKVSCAVRRVALFVDPDPALVVDVINTGVIDLLQFHGDETEAFCQQFDVPYMKAIRVRSQEQATEDAGRYASAEMILLDRYQKNVPGGTGKVFDWDIAANLVQGIGLPIVLAGGLQAGNVAEAVNQVQPFGVDVSSGVEKMPGVKDPAKVQQFIKASKSVRS